MDGKLLILCMIFLLVQCSSGMASVKTCSYRKNILACQNFRNFQHLKTGKFPIDMISLPANLVKLYINNFDLTQIDHDAFYRMNELQLLDLSHNKLEVLLPDWFYSLTKLITLILSHNLLRAFSDQKLFSNNNLLLHLDLSNNNISYFNINVVANLTQLNLIKLENNSFVCDCELKNIKIWATKRNVTMNSSCELPPSYTIVPWTHLDSMNSDICPSIALGQLQQQDTSVFHMPIHIPLWVLIISFLTIIVVVIISIMCVCLFVNHVKNTRTLSSTNSFSGIYDDIMPEDLEFTESAAVCQEDMTKHLRTEERYSKTPTCREEIKSICENEQSNYMSFQNDLSSPGVGIEPVASENMYSEDGYLNPRTNPVSSVDTDVTYECIGNDINSNETQSMEGNLSTQSVNEYEHVNDNSLQENTIKHVQVRNTKSSNSTKIEESSVKPSEFHEQQEIMHNASDKNQHMKNVTDCVENESEKTEINENAESGNGCYHYIQNEYSEDGYLEPRKVNSYSEIEVRNSYEYITRNSKAEASSPKTLACDEQQTSSTTSHYECIENIENVNDKCNSKLKYGKKAADSCESATKNRKRNMLASALNLFHSRHKNDSSTSAVRNTNSEVYDDVGNTEDPCYMEIQEKH